MKMWMLHYYLVLLVCMTVNRINGETVACGKVLPHNKSQCEVWYDEMKCENKSTLLRVGHCMTHKEGEGTYAMKCPYFQLEGHTVIEQEYIKLPDNISELNNFMCGSMNRKGFLCKDCIDGFGPSLTSVGYKCSNCTEVWYGVPLYMMQLFLPITLLYLIITVFRIHLASAPMSCLIMYSQIQGIIILLNPRSALHENIPLFKINTVFYGVWNLDFFQYILPPFCVSSSLQLSYIFFLGYISSIYPVFLILLTWVCIQLHDCNCRLIVLIWRPFHKVFVKLRRGWDTRRDMIDVVASFFLLSFSKISYYSLLILQCPQFTRLDEQGNVSCNFAMAYDPSIICVSNNTKYILIAIFALLGNIIFNILPALLLILYPIRTFRICLNKCRMNRIVIVTFVEKFHGCYKDGLDGGRDLRSFSGLYFLLKFTLPISIRINTHIAGTGGCSILFYTFFALTVTIALVRPYKRVYMNLFDTFLLTDLTIIFHLCSGGYFNAEAIKVMTLTTLPTVLFGCLALYKIFAIIKTKQKLTSLWRLCLKRCCHLVQWNYKFRSRQRTYANSETNDSIEGHNHPLETPTSMIVDIKTYECQS